MKYEQQRCVVMGRMSSMFIIKQNNFKSFCSNSLCVSLFILNFNIQQLLVVHQTTDFCKYVGSINLYPSVSNEQNI